MASFLDSAKLFVPSQYSQSRVVGLSKQKKLENILYSKSRIRNLVIVSCSHHNRGVERETLIKPCYPKKGRLGFVSLSLRLLCLIRLSWASYRRSLSLLLPYRYSSSGLALLLSTTLRRGVFATSPFLSSLVEAMTMVFMSELGDKSMFATALLATRYRPWLVFIGAMVALTMMTGIACFLGNLMHLLPPIYTHYGSIILFLYFGIQMIKNSYTKNQRESTELGDAEKLVGSFKAENSSFWSILGKIFLLIFTAEWCDRSMLATMALASSHSPLAIISGATIANVICSGIAVLGAALVSSKISEQKVSFVGGLLFLFFGIKSWVDGPEEE
ncbi:uncharacterized protein Gasu_59980 [Galdieria sulphuraria]|uniref:GDT1 family protein n=1 Tax=Galdieria sulphuraria TaxID=130081 RepID=M2WRF4_GALSU|nr:uncharacterized protein Gasu_59980 [Galdieria sulphuraria]EME26380.1 hypothetical protein Gasu_59980 [Galdieria sulphuraria]|eukprot:XP_005702900.1 hypothetical protein Gasu_59980 [Galdieria sulphuraria]